MAEIEMYEEGEYCGTIVFPDAEYEKYKKDMEELGKNKKLKGLEWRLVPQPKGDGE